MFLAIWIYKVRQVSWFLKPFQVKLAVHMQLHNATFFEGKFPDQYPEL
uniref:Uncharacterized protein n=1 Tax=Nelumbo nucifera TaxID=4432 RepID=A0A822ZA00_NELNU|nr:TPA_asm: hypothetical protein HUJ06_015716 [Nelumbo nucifera]